MLEHLESLSWAADNPSGWEVLSEALLVAFASCDDLDDLLKVLGCGGIADLTYLEGGFEPIHLEAIFARARAWSSPGDAAGAIGMALRATAFDPGALLVADAAMRGDKPHLFAVLDAQISRFREDLTAPAPMRAASAHALARCPAANGDDVARLIALVDREADDEALASFLLAAFAIAKRREVEIDAGRFVAYLGHASVLVRCCAAAAIAHVRPIGRRGSEVLAESMRAAAPLPVGWGWRWGDRVETTDAIAVRVLAWAPNEVPLAVVAALCELDGETMHESEALFRSAFAEVAPLGLSPEDVDADQRVALRAFTKPGYGSRRDLLKRLGFHLQADVAAFLEGSAPLWRVREVETSSGVHRWHMVRIWREHIEGVIGREDAVDAIVAGQSARELMESVCHIRHGPLLAPNASDEQHAERDQLLTLSILQRLKDDGADVAAHCRAMFASGTRWHAASWALTMLLTFESPPLEWDGAIAVGLSGARAAKPFEGLLAQLPPERRDAIVARAQTSLF